VSHRHVVELSQIRSSEILAEVPLQNSSPPATARANECPTYAGHPADPIPDTHQPISIQQPSTILNTAS